MIDLRRRRNLGDTAEEYLEELALFLDSDGEGLWAIVPAGKSFGFGGPDLSEFEIGNASPTTLSRRRSGPGSVLKDRSPADGASDMD